MPTYVNQHKHTHDTAIISIFYLFTIADIRLFCGNFNGRNREKCGSTVEPKLYTQEIPGKDVANL